MALVAMDLIFSMLQITITIVSASYLLCVHGIGGRIVYRSGIVVVMWYIRCHPQVMCSMRGAIACSQIAIFFVTNSLTFCCYFSFHYIYRPMIVFTSSLCSTYSIKAHNSSSTISQLRTCSTKTMMAFLIVSLNCFDF
jgi:hypothetical protein